MSSDKEIIVEITHEDLVDMAYPAMVIPILIGKLKAAGIPVIGVLLFQGVKSGTLIQEDDFINCKYIFRWKP